MIQLPADQPTWSHELAGTTQKGAGMMPYVVSGKRKSWYYYQIGNLDSDTEDLTESIALTSSSADVTALQAEIAKLKKDKASASDLDAVEDLLTIAYIALVVAFIALVFSVYLALKPPTGAASGGSPPVQEVQMTGVAGAEGGNGNGKHSQI